MNGTRTRELSRRDVLKGGLATMSMGALAACGDSDDETPQNEGAESPGDAEVEQAQIVYQHWSPTQGESLEEIARAFAAANDGIEVEVRQIGGFQPYWTGLEASTQSGSAPDVFWMNPIFLPLYASNGMLEPVSASIDTSRYSDAVLSMASYEGEVYGVPKDVDTELLWYNKSLFDAAGVPYPSSDWTWDDLTAAAEELTDASAGVWGISADFHYIRFYPAIWQAGGYIISPDGMSSGYDAPEAIEGLRFWIGLIENGWSPTQAQMVETETSQMFLSGRTAMYYNLPLFAQQVADTEQVRDSVDVSTLPAGRERASTLNGLTSAVYARGSNKEAAIKFADFVGGPEAAQLQITMPAMGDAQGEWLETAFPEFNLSEVVPEQLQVGRPQPVLQNTRALRQAEDDILIKAWTLAESIETVAKELAERVNGILAEQGGGLVNT